MTDTWDIMVKWACAALGGVVAWFSGFWTPLLTVLAWAMVLDYFTGLIVAFSGKSPKTDGGGVSSEIGWRGLLKKLVIIAVIGVAALVDMATGSAVFMAAAATYYVANEGISILENAVLMGVSVPAPLKNALEVMRDRKTAEIEADDEEEDDY